MCASLGYLASTMAIIMDELSGFENPCEGVILSFYSEEKKQKTFMSLTRFSPAAYAQDARIFWFPPGGPPFFQ